MGGELPVPLRRDAGAGTRAVPRAHRSHAAFRGVRRERRLAKGHQGTHDRLPRAHQPAAAAGHPLPDPHGARRADARAHAGERGGLVPRHRLAAGAGAASHGPRRALRVGLPDPAATRREVARRTVGRRERLHRPARVVRGLPAGRGLDRPRPHVWPARRRGPHPARGHARAGQRGAGRRRGEHEQRGLPPHDEGHADVRITARDAALHAGAMERDRRARPSRGRATAGDGRPADARRRAHLRRDHQPRRRRVEYRRARADQTRLRIAAVAEADRPLRRQRLHALRAGQVVSGRTAAALGPVGVVAGRRRAVRRGCRAVRRRPRRREGRSAGRHFALDRRRRRPPDRRHRPGLRPAGRPRDRRLRGRLPGHVARRIDSCRSTARWKRPARPGRRGWRAIRRRSRSASCCRSRDPRT